MGQLRTQAVGEWEMMGDCFFSREMLYDMSWGDFELQDKRLACAPYGGPIAAIRDERRAVLVTHGSSAVAAGGGLKPVLRTFTAAGASLGACVWEGGRLVDWAWTDEQQLAVVDAKGKVTLFSPFAEKIREFSFGAAVERDGVAAAKVYGSGVVVVTEPRQAAAAGDATSAVESCEIWVVQNLRDPKPTRLKSPSKDSYRTAATAAAAAKSTGGAAGGGGGGASFQPASLGIIGLGGLGRPGLPQCLAVLDPQFTLSRGVEQVFVVVGGSLWQLDEASATDHYPPPLVAAGGAVHLEMSPDGACVALYTVRDNRLMVMSADLNRTLLELETGRDSTPPVGMHWVGSDAVLLTWPDTAVLVGPYGDSVQWSFSEDIMAVISELDGCRLLLGRSSQLLLRRVPECCVQGMFLVPSSGRTVFRPGATSPAAQLWDARALYDDQNPRCDKILRNIQDSGPAFLPAAVSTCIQAAGHDINPVRQRALMRAAAYGRPFCSPDFPRQLMYGVACRLRILSAVRDPRVGLPLTMKQLEALSLPVLVGRLISYRQWLLAYRIAEEEVLVTWACAKISAASAANPGGPPVEDEQLKDAIVSKLKCCPQVGYARLAEHALEVGRRHLALRLLEEERSAAKQVPLLLRLGAATASSSTATAGGSSRAAGRGSVAADVDREGCVEGSRDEVLQRALRKAVESGDPDLVHLVLVGTYRSRPLPEFWALVAPRHLARNLFIKYCKTKEPELLETILTAAAAGVTTTAAAAAAAAAFPPAVAISELASLQFRAALVSERQQLQQLGGTAAVAASPGGAEAAAAKLATALADVAQKYGQSRECSFQSRAVSEMSCLLREQVRLERETGQRLFVGLSLVDTLGALIRGTPRSSGGVPLAGSRLWRLVARLPDSPSKAEEYSGLGMAREAAEVAARIRRPTPPPPPLSLAAHNFPTSLPRMCLCPLLLLPGQDSDLFARIQSAVAAGSPAGLAIAQIKERFQSTFRCRWPSQEGP
ncbi:hypothetical protein VOLCADRAFT_105988 [Volvox carteri f. nagariensis]|uniref:Vps16 N-terminal domain-containing protein n=1 Tax=Volvox carteri f. nagariensis TaxID=3068 RepID=D8U453_VOLCA|nr:uncharacterized protein VOLCADRAFT_105988 [Volvox carteri f. nagariensis]EFJ45438.1 hypothetical protein VOLCADRAFT_105988 [Volvox carteri f. nagariensis]|eukprot:XP_002953465.1 hypothetical protein VOLCADRAFT_105988 [Volvox carteri f. nagariensis]